MTSLAQSLEGTAGAMLRGFGASRTSALLTLFICGFLGAGLTLVPGGGWWTVAGGICLGITFLSAGIAGCAAGQVRR